MEFDKNKNFLYFVFCHFCNVHVGAHCGLLLSLSLSPKVITLIGFHCTDFFQFHSFTEFVKELKLDILLNWSTPELIGLVAGNWSFSLPMIQGQYIFFKVAGILSGNCVLVDSSSKSMDLYRVMDHKSRFGLNPGSWTGLKKICFELWIKNPANFQKIWIVFTNPMISHESLVLKGKTNPWKSKLLNTKSLRIRIGRLANPDSNP